MIEEREEAKECPTPIPFQKKDITTCDDCMKELKRGKVNIWITKDGTFCDRCHKKYKKRR